MFINVLSQKTMRIPGNRNFQIKCSAPTGNQPNYSLKIPILNYHHLEILERIFFCTQFRWIWSLLSLFLCKWGMSLSWLQEAVRISLSLLFAFLVFPSLSSNHGIHCSLGTMPAQNASFNAVILPSNPEGTSLVLQNSLLDHPPILSAFYCDSFEYILM